MPLAVLVTIVALRLFASPVWSEAIRRPWHTYLSGLTTHALTRPGFADRLEDVFVVLAGIAIVLLCARARFFWAALATVVAIVAGGVFSWRMAVSSGLHFDAAYPALAIAAVYLAGLSVPILLGAGERARLRRSLDSHVAASTMAALTRRPELLNLSGETRTMTYLVCGIRRYGPIAESFAEEPEALRRLTRRALSALSDTALRYHGVVDRLMPGGLTAFFNAPLEDPEHAVHACECALAMTRAMESINHAFEQERRSDGSPYPPIEIGIGIHSGVCVVGDFGTEARPEYTVAGIPVQLAEEIEAAGAKYGPAIIVTEAARKLAERNFAFLEVDTVLSVNGAGPTKLYALLGNPLLRASPKFRALSTFHDHIFQSYRAKEWGKTKALIEQCRALSGASPQLYDLYMKRIAYYEENAPPQNWDGAVRVPIA